MRHLKRWLLVFAPLMIFSSCVTHKKKEEVGKIGKMYHDVTSKYNRNFNANVLIDETLAQLDASYQDDYSEILPMYPVLMKENPTQLAEPMDRAIEKASVAISIHRPSHWTDDNYIIIGRAQYLKEDYESAEATFRYLVKHYDPNNIISQQAQKSRNVNKKLSAKEKAQAKKESEKERSEKIKQRRRDIAKSQKEKKKRAKQAKKARIRDRKQQIKEREQIAKAEAAKEARLKSKEEKTNDKKKQNKPFDENPALPKIKGNPDNYFMKHKPAHQEAQLWLAKTLIERDRFGEAENILRSLENKPNTFKEILAEIYPVQAHSALSREQYSAASGPLMKAIESTSDRAKKARYAFILAQVYECTKQYTEAAEAYDRVIKLRPNYDMNFSAQLNKIKMQYNSANLDRDKYATTIKRMIRDGKNVDYRDQLYFAMAQNDLKSGNKEQAIENLSESIRASTGNLVQKAESYYTLAQLYFADEDFVKSKYYFDSTLTVMSQNDPRKEQITTYAKNLDKIAANLEQIELQDSLIRISQLSEKELKELATSLKKEAILADAAAKAAAQAPQSNLTTLTSVPQTAALGQKGSLFFAYDDRAVKKGQRDFSRVWGNIALQDNWRQSSSAAFDDITADVSDTGGQQRVGNISDTEIDEIFKDVPKSDEQMAAAQKKIEEALFELGQLFRSELSNNEKSIESLEMLLGRFPDTEHALDAYYLLYVAHSEMAHVDRANYYSKKITAEHADSEYAKYINDPSYLKNALTDEEKVEKYYQEVHTLYEQQQYDAALRQLRDARKDLPAKHALQSKFSLLTALCIGRLQGREPYVNALKDLIAKYPETEEEERAKEIIRLLGIRFTETSEGIEEINPDAYFSVSPQDKLHMIIVALKKEGLKTNDARVSVSDYNKKYYKLDKLNVAVIVLGENNDLPLLVIRRFDSREKAMSYYEGVQKNLKDFLGDNNLYEIFATSQTNYRKIVQLKSIDLYREFFVKEYLSK
ncbi:MAG: tetratricopeptide repeat protein [Saprospiraceae bacterium]|nr:tetratricopeptide repeat protein [Saprospiraceae bacterium]